MHQITTQKQSLEVANAKLRVAVWLKGVTWEDLLFPRFSNGFVAQHKCRHEALDTKLYYTHLTEI